MDIEYIYTSSSRCRIQSSCISEINSCTMNVSCSTSCSQTVCSSGTTDVQCSSSRVEDTRGCLSSSDRTTIVSDRTCGGDSTRVSNSEVSSVDKVCKAST